MRSSQRHVIVLGLLLGLLIEGLGQPTQVVAQSRVGTTAAPFLILGTGARGSALGHAYTAVATGGDACFGIQLVPRASSTKSVVVLFLPTHVGWPTSTITQWVLWFLPLLQEPLGYR